jgi:hypothetical protein
MTKGRQSLHDYYMIARTLGSMGPLREPEIAAATGIDEDRVYFACKVAVKLGHFARRADGEISQNAT